MARATTTAVRLTSINQSPSDSTHRVEPKLTRRAVQGQGFGHYSSSERHLMRNPVASGLGRRASGALDSRASGNDCWFEKQGSKPLALLCCSESLKPDACKSEKGLLRITLSDHLSYGPKTSMTAHPMHHSSSMRSPIRTSSTLAPQAA